jgi:hypothetical protein
MFSILQEEEIESALLLTGCGITLLGALDLEELLLIKNHISASLYIYIGEL